MGYLGANAIATVMASRVAGQFASQRVKVADEVKEHGGRTGLVGNICADGTEFSVFIVCDDNGEAIEINLRDLEPDTQK